MCSKQRPSTARASGFSIGPNPAGRPVEGLTLRVRLGKLRRRGPDADAPWTDAGRARPLVRRPFQARRRLSRDRDGGLAPGRGTRFRLADDRVWINPSPNAANLNMARAYAGTVMLEGATLSEGRGTTRPLELFGAPDLEPRRVMDEMERLAPRWLAGCKLARHLLPTDVSQACRSALSRRLHPCRRAVLRPQAFKPWRLQSLAFKAIRRLDPNYDLWRDFPYEYEFDKLAIDVINGSPLLREWVDDPEAGPTISMPSPFRTSKRGPKSGSRT